MGGSWTGHTLEVAAVACVCENLKTKGICCVLLIYQKAVGYVATNLHKARGRQLLLWAKTGRRKQDTFESYMQVLEHVANR